MKAGQLLELITSPDPQTRNLAVDQLCAQASTAELVAACVELDRFRRRCDNLYQRVRALFFLYDIHRFHLPFRQEVAVRRQVSYAGWQNLLKRRFEEALDLFLVDLEAAGPSLATCSSLASAYQLLGFQTLADQVRRSVRSVRGNQWMFRTGHPAEHPLRVRRELLPDAGRAPLAPVLCERTPVRMDLSHSAWSDIFFLGMDYPEGARVLNVSIDLAVVGRDLEPRPPVETFLRVIDEPVLRLVSVDLASSAEITDVAEVFDFARDYLGLLKAGIIASGIVPPGLEGCGCDLAPLLERLVGPGQGLEVTSHVRGIPKGSRLAVSTNLLASMIALCMRATGQTRALTGGLGEEERRLVAARAILGEWLGGSGGGWQDSGGVWPGIKLISGALASEGDPEWTVSRGRLLPDHELFGESRAPAALRRALERSLVLVHGGMAQNVGPILEMVTEKYLLRCPEEWQARQRAGAVLDGILEAFPRADVRDVARLTTENFFGPIQTIIPWSTTHYTEELIRQVRERFGEQFWGFWMLGGMSGGGMGFIFDPARRTEGRDALQEIMSRTRRALSSSLPFAMEPVVYDFAINDSGTHADLLAGPNAMLPTGYYRHVLPDLLRADPRSLSPLRQAELEALGARQREAGQEEVAAALLDRLLPQPSREEDGAGTLRRLLEDNGFDQVQHERIQADLRRGRIGLAQNRLPANTAIEDVHDQDVVDATTLPDSCRQRGQAALAEGRVAVVTLAAGAGSRWTQGAGVVKALHPFCRMGGAHRRFLEIHLAKSRRTAREAGTALPHVVTTSYLTHEPIAHWLEEYGRDRDVPHYLSPGRAVGLRMVPMVRDLRFAWEETAHQVLDEQAQKVLESLHGALIGWAHAMGEGADYTDNEPEQCLHPVGHWYEIPNLLRNGVLAELLREHPRLTTLLLHNIDTLGADVDPALLGWFLESDKALAYEVVSRQIEDIGGGLARVDGQVRLVEGLALPREEDEFALSYYNSMTTWIDIDRLLEVLGLSRAEVGDADEVKAAVRRLAARLPTYVTLKDVKKRWGHGQEDVFPVTQFEKLWGDMTGLSEVGCGFVVVPRRRGQQLKDPAQLDGWARDGSAAFVESLCTWE